MSCMRKFKAPRLNGNVLEGSLFECCRITFSKDFLHQLTTFFNDFCKAHRIGEGSAHV